MELGVPGHWHHCLRGEGCVGSWGAVGDCGGRGSLRTPCYATGTRYVPNWGAKLGAVQSFLTEEGSALPPVGRVSFLQRELWVEKPTEILGGRSEIRVSTNSTKIQKWSTSYGMI